MPRPKEGYTNAAGQPVPGTNDVCGRYKEPGGLFYWYWDNGRKGLPFRSKTALDIGTAVHGAIDRFMQGAEKRELLVFIHDILPQECDRELAYASFRAFLQWHEQCDVKLIEHEVSLVSEAHQYGGTPDWIVLIKNRVGIIDFKTAKEVKEPYQDQKIAIRAHANLWNEHNPKFKIESYHLIMLPKNGGAPGHHAYDELDREWELFKLYRRAYDLERSGVVAKMKTVKAAPDKRPAINQSYQSIDPPRRAHQLLMSEVTSHPQQLSMAEVLRAYGHAPEIRA